MYSDQGDGERALEELLRAVELDPEFARAYLNLGTTCFWLGRYPEALKYYRSYIRLADDPSSLIEDRVELLAIILETPVP